MVNNKKRDKGQNTMLLRDVNCSRQEMFGRLNKLIKKQFGFSISENISYSKILETTSLLNREISELKLDKSLRESPELTKLVLMRDALTILKENYDMQPQVSVGNPYRSLMDGLVSAVVDSVCLGDDFDDAIKFTMREYRSSKWRFPDDRVEEDLRKLSRERIISKCSEPSLPVLESSNLTVTFTTDDLYEIHNWLAAGTKPSEVTHSKIQDFYKQNGQVPQPDEQCGDEFYSDQLMKDIYLPNLNKTPRTLFKVNEMKSNIVKKLRTLLETEVAEAEIIATARSFASEVQEMIEKLSRLQNEELPPLTDSMKEEFGIALANNFHSKSQAALQGALESLYYAKDEIDNSVISIATGKSIGNDMDMDISNDPSMSADPDAGSEKFDSLAGLDVGDEESLGDIGDMEDEFGGSDAMTGSDDPLGRTKKESIQSLKSAIMEMEQKIARLSKKKSLG